MTVRHFHTKVVGVTYRNDDGTHRQDIVVTLQPRQPLRLVHQPDNRKDSNAIAVMTRRGQQVGYLRSELAASVAEDLQEGKPVRAWVSNITGHEPLGVNLAIVVGDAGTRDAELRKHYNANVKPTIRVGFVRRFKQVVGAVLVVAVTVLVLVAIVRFAL